MSKLRWVTTFFILLGMNVVIRKTGPTADQHTAPVYVFMRFVSVENIVLSYPDQEVAGSDVL